MLYNYFEDFQYDSCISKGICSINPKTSSLREVLVMYLKLLAFYTIELKHFGVENTYTKDIILNTLSGLMANLETGNKQFYLTLLDLKTIILESKKKYQKICKEKRITPKKIHTDIKLQADLDIIGLIKLGEKEFSNKVKLIPENKRVLYELLYMILKSMCINLVELNFFSHDKKIYFHEILYLLNTLNYPNTSFYVLKKKLKIAVNINYCLTKQLHSMREQYYGKQEEGTVSYSTVPNKAILVAGTNLEELKNVLEATKNKNIDVYTHGEMIIAYTYPKFKKYKHLKGQFGKGIENCLLDFATFPGAILIAKHSLETIEYLYRGRLFTTDNFSPQGVIQMKGNDYSQLIQSALSSKGFKKGQKHKNDVLGCSTKNLIKSLDSFFALKENLKQLVIFTSNINTIEQKTYLEEFINFKDESMEIISLTDKIHSDKILTINTAPDFYYVFRIIGILKDKMNKDFDVSLVVLNCNKHTISNLITLKNLGVKNILLNKCTPIMLNPKLTYVLKNEFDIDETSTAKLDLEKILLKNINQI